MDPKLNYGLWMIVICQNRLTVMNAPLWWGILIMEIEQKEAITLGLEKLTLSMT